MGNEPSFDVPWQYDYVGAPEETQHVVRQIEVDDFSDRPAGLPGNDDLGEVSSWYVWASLLGYPETPGLASIALGSPLFPSIAIHLGNGKTITEEANASASSPYVQKLTLDGSSWANAYLPASLFSAGGSLLWTLGSAPDQAWAAAGAPPPSNTSGLLPALGAVGPQYGKPPVVSAGSELTLQVSAQSMSGSPVAVNWTGSVAAGMQLRPASGALSVRGESQSTETARLSVAAGVAPGDYLVTFALTTSTGRALPPVVQPITVTVAAGSPSHAPPEAAGAASAASGASRSLAGPE
jgi:hypothetical protein